MQQKKHISTTCKVTAHKLGPLLRLTHSSILLFEYDYPCLFAILITKLPERRVFVNENALLP